MPVFHEPKQYAQFVAIGPLAIPILLLATYLDPAYYLMIYFAVGIGAPVATAYGIYNDARVLRRTRGKAPLGLFWAIAGFFLAPIVGLLYLVNRRRYF